VVGADVSAGTVEPDRCLAKTNIAPASAAAADPTPIPKADRDVTPTRVCMVT
jgi:hypothetical protein